MTFPKSNTTVDKQGVIGIRRIIGYCHCSGMGKLIAGTTDKEIKGIFLIEGSEYLFQRGIFVRDWLGIVFYDKIF